jgi:hypothetical protein
VLYDDVVTAIIDEASRASYGRPDPLGPVMIAPLSSSDELVTELARVAEPGDAGARALEVLAQRIARARERGIDLPLADAFDAWSLADGDRRIVAALVVAALAERAPTVAQLKAVVGATVVTERLDAQAPLRALGLVTLAAPETPWPARPVLPAPCLVALAWGSRALDGSVGAQPLQPTQAPIDGDTQALAEACRRTTALQPITQVRGGERDEDLIERVARVAVAVGGRALLVDGAVADAGALAREGLRAGATLILRGAEARAVAELARLPLPVVVVGGEAPGALVVELAPLTAAERRRELAAAGGPLDDAALAPRLGPATLRRFAERARAVPTAAALAELWPRPTLVRVGTPRSWDELLLPQAVGEAIVEVVAAARRGNGGEVVCLCGPGGVGKTMTSALIADDVELPLWELSLRRLAAESRAAVAPDLEAVMRAAEEGGALVALDDADAVAIDDPGMLAVARWLECTRTTVLVHSRGARPLDASLSRLVTLEVALPPPDQATRVQLWLSALAELSDQARTLAATPATGGQIVAWAARARRLAELEGEPPSLRHVRQAMGQEDGAGHGR